MHIIFIHYSMKSLKGIQHAETNSCSLSIPFK